MKRVNKRRGFGIIVKSLVAAVLVTSIVISTLFGSVGAEFVKSLSKSVDFEAAADIPWSYHLVDYSGENNAKKTTTGYYIDYKNIEQNIVIKAQQYPVYQIKVPVSEAGLYTLDFTVDFLRKGQDESAGITTRKSDSPSYKEGSSTIAPTTESLNNAVGCKIDTNKTAFDDVITQLNTDAATKIGYNTTQVFGPNVNNGSGYHDYQWKTLVPSRAENVSLTFEVDSAAVDRGFVLWVWDLQGLPQPTGSGIFTYIMKLSNISTTKVDTPTGPYIDFSNTYYVNNALHPVYNVADGGNKDNSGGYTALRLSVGSHPVIKGSASGTGGDGYIRGAVEAGKTRTSVGRGTFVTEATYNSMTMQAEALIYGFHCDANDKYKGAVNGLYAKDRNWGNPNRYTNIISFGMPIENVEKGKTYKVTFDFSVARQGTSAGTADDSYSNEVADGKYIDYADFHSILAAQSRSYQAEEGNIHFESFLYTGVTGYEVSHNSNNATKYIRTITDHGRSQIFSVSGAIADTSGRGSYVDPNKIRVTTTENEEPSVITGYVTRYNELWNVQMGDVGNADYGTVESVNDYRNRSQEIFNSYDAGYNMFNAVRHTEYNGQNVINWITFTNSTFTFTVPTNLTDDQLQDLHWVWAIDAFIEYSWNRIKFENVRIEEVVEYGSNVENDSLVINGEDADFETRDDEGLYRGANGSGQNGGARAYETAIPMANMNTYAPVYDASGITAKTGSASTITFSGYAVVKGGVEKYMWSADNGKTWYDMKTSILSNADVSTLIAAESHAENSMIGLHIENANDSNGDEVKYTFGGTDYICERANFDANSINGKNAYYTITASMEGTPYENKTNLNIIFAAVPSVDPDMRCEIMRVINYNPPVNYVSQTLEVRSDVLVGANDYLSAAYITGNYDSENTFDFSSCYGVSANSGDRVADAGLYSLRAENSSDDYEDIRALFKDFPVKKSMTFYGYAMLEGGTEGYYWSLDYGKTWIPCIADSTSITSTDPYSDGFLRVARKNWYDGRSFDPAGSMLTNAFVPQEGAGLKIDLSEYTGKIVDVIVAAKPAKGGAYVPLGRVDNVAVYGDYGSFFTKINKIYVKGADGKNIDDTGNPDAFGSYDYASGDDINNASMWSNLEEWMKKAYTIYEPYNVDYTQARLFTPNNISVYAGKEVVIRGYIGVTMPEGVSASDYKAYYVFDHGERQQPPYTLGLSDAADSLAASQQTNFECSKVINLMGDVFKITIPSTYAKGTIHNLLLYIELQLPNNGGTVRYPVFNANLIIAG